MLHTHLCNKCLVLVHTCAVLFTVVKHWISTSVFHIAFLIIYAQNLQVCVSYIKIIKYEAKFNIEVVVTTVGTKPVTIYEQLCVNY